MQHNHNGGRTWTTACYSKTLAPETAGGYRDGDCPQARVEAQDYHYVLQDAPEALKSSADIAREYMNDKDQDKEGSGKKKGCVAHTSVA